MGNEIRQQSCCKTFRLLFLYLTSKRSNIENFVSEIRMLLLLSYLLNYLSSLIERMCRGFCSGKFCLYFIV